MVKLSDKNSNEKIGAYKKKNRNIIVMIMGVVVALVLINVFLLADTFQGYKIDASTANQYGGFIGGYIGTFLTFISVILLYLSFSNQIESAEKEKFENRFFELLKLHRENLSEFELGNQSGRKVFVSMLREFRELKKVLNDLLVEHNVSVSKKEFSNIAYIVFYYGVGPNSSRVLKKTLSRANGISGDEDLINIINDKFKCGTTQAMVKHERNLSYRPFGGHQSRLGHYYRHMYQMVMYVDNQTIDIDRREYIKILRAQLSNHEQAMLFFNANSDMGKQWDKNKLIENYGLIKNLPEEFIDSLKELDPKSVYDNFTFEWEDGIDQD